MRQGAHFLLPVKLVFNRKRSSATTSKIVILFFSIVKVVDLCALWNLGRNWHYEFRPWKTDGNLRTGGIFAFWRLSVCVMWPNNSADSRALFRAGRQLLQVGSHDIQDPRI